MLNNYLFDFFNLLYVLYIDEYKKIFCGLVEIESVIYGLKV